MNIIGWARLIVLIFRELIIRYGDKVIDCIKVFLNKVVDLLSYEDKKLLYQYYNRMNKFNVSLEIELNLTSSIVIGNLISYLTKEPSDKLVL